MIKINNLSYKIDQKTIFKNLTLDVSKSQIVTIMAPSGRGKTTLLKLISGLLISTSGEIFHENLKITAPSKKRVIIFQDHLLFPWMTAKENIDFVLKAQNKSIEMSLHFLNLVKLANAQNLYPHQLSGGMKQRVGIARALASNPEILLLDEPFASIDPIIRNEIIQEIKVLVREFNLTVFLVTHNIEEALYFSDRIIVLGNQSDDIAEDILINMDKTESIMALKKYPLFSEFEEKIYNLLKKGLE